MPLFRKKPVVIEARCFDGGTMSRDDMFAWLDEHDTLCQSETLGHGRHVLLIPTLEGTHRADPGDWIIKGVKGEFYPCKPDIFAATYEPATTQGEGLCPSCRKPLPCPDGCDWGGRGEGVLP